MPVEVAESPGLTVPLVVVISATVPIPPRVVPVLTETSPAVPSTSSVPASTVAPSEPSLASRSSVPCPCLLSPLVAVTTPLRSSVAPELSTVIVPASGLKVIGRLIVEDPVLCEESIVPASCHAVALDRVAARPGS